MPSILDLNLSKRAEITTLTTGEYTFRILSADFILAKDDKDANDSDYKGRRISLRCESIDNPMSDDVYHQIFIPHTGDSEKSAAKKLNNIADFMEKIDLDPDAGEIDLTEWVGLEFSANTKMDSYGGQERAVINQVFKA